MRVKLLLNLLSQLGSTLLAEVDGESNVSNGQNNTNDVGTGPGYVEADLGIEDVGHGDESVEAAGNQIYYEYRNILESAPDSSGEIIAEPYPGIELRQGMSGQSIRLIQEYLSFIALFFRSINTVATTGYFGPGTAAAVRRFQSEFGLEPTGVVDEATWNRIALIYSDLQTAENRTPEQAPASLVQNGQ